MNIWNVDTLISEVEEAEDILKRVSRICKERDAYYGVAIGLHAICVACIALNDVLKMIDNPDEVPEHVPNRKNVVKMITELKGIDDEDRRLNTILLRTLKRIINELEMAMAMEEKEGKEVN